MSVSISRLASEFLVHGPIVDIEDDSLATGGVCTGRLYDPNKDNEVTSGTTGSTWNVSRASVLSVSDIVRLRLDDGAYHETTIDTIDTTAGTIDVGAAPPSMASPGQAMAVKLGADVAMLEDGVTAVYRGTLGPSALALLNVDRVRIEYDALVDGVTGHHQFLASVVGPVSI